MIRADVLVSSPVYLAGLVHTFADTGITVVSARYGAAEDPSWLADVALIDTDALADPGDVAPVSDAARFTAVLVLFDALTTEPDRYLQAGAQAALSRREPGERLVEAVRVAATRCLPRTACPGAAAGHLPEQRNGQLSEREDQVLDQISHGLTHGQIATRLGISPHTVDTYVKRIRAKLGVANKAELTRAALLARQAL